MEKKELILNELKTALELGVITVLDVQYLLQE